MSHIIPDSNIIITSNTKAATEYTFDAATGVVRVIDVDFNKFMGVVNLTAGEVIYNAIDPSLSGTIYKNELDVDFDTSAQSDNDELLVLYISENTIDKTESLLKRLINEQKKTNKLLTKIYQ